MILVCLSFLLSKTVPYLKHLPVCKTIPCLSVPEACFANSLGNACLTPSSGHSWQNSIDASWWLGCCTRTADIQQASNTKSRQNQRSTFGTSGAVQVKRAKKLIIAVQQSAVCPANCQANRQSLLDMLTATATRGTVAKLL